MSSSHQEINEELEESLLPVEREGSSATASSQQQDDALGRKSTPTTRTKEKKQPEGEITKSERRTTSFSIPRRGDDGCVLSQMTATPAPAKREGGFSSLRRSGHWRTPYGKRTLVSCLFAYPSCELGRLISEHGTRISHAVDAEGTPIFWNAVEQDRVDYANMLLDYAKSNEVPVTFKCENDDLLSRAVANGSEAHVEYILDKLTKKYASVSETIELLNKHLADYLSQFPKIAQAFLKENKFAMEYARFEAPKHMFDVNGETGIGMLDSFCPESWQLVEARKIKFHWFLKSQYKKELWDLYNRDWKVKVVAKFSCISPVELFDAYGTRYLRRRVRRN